MKTQSDNICLTLYYYLSGSKHKKVVASIAKRMGAANPLPTLSSPLLPSPVDLSPSIILVKDPETGAPAGGYKCKACDCVLNSDDQLRGVSTTYCWNNDRWNPKNADDLRRGHPWFHQIWEAHINARRLSTTYLLKFQHIATERHQNMEIGIPCDPPKSREERRFHPYSGPAKFAQKASNSANASSWKARQTHYDTQKMQPLSHFFKKGQGMW